VRQEALTPPEHVRPLWAFIWLVATFVMGITATVGVYHYELVPIEATARLTSIILVGEALWYCLVLMLPADRVVPPGRTLLSVPLAMGMRTLMAMAAAQIAVADSDQTFDQLWRAFHSGLWLSAVIQVFFVGAYLWLVRAALEVPREGLAESQRSPAQVDYATEFRIPTPPPDEETAQRQNQLLSALMEAPDAPVEEIREAAEEVVSETTPEPTAAQSEQEDAVVEQQPATTVEKPVEESVSEQPAPEPKTPEEPLPEEQAEPSTGGGPVKEPATDSAAVEVAEPELEQPESRRTQLAMDLREGVPATEGATLKPEDNDATDTLPPVAPPPSDEAPEAVAEEPSPPEATEPEGATPPSEAEIPASAAVGMATPEQQAAIRQAMTQISIETPVEISRSADGRIYALCGATATDELLKVLDTLFGALLATADVLDAGTPESFILMADAGALVAVSSPDCGSQVLIAAEARTKVGQLSMLSRRARAAAATLDLGNECSLAATTLAALPPVERTSEPLAITGIQQLMTFSGAGRDIIVAAPPADAAFIAASAEAVHEAAMSLAEAMEMGPVDRILIECATSGLVIGPYISDTELLLAIRAEATAKMGGANIALGNLRDAMRGEA
jgi:predicted regulator of Ras-like GTPase activity (Roadblock/LC7/MglB family)